MLVVNRFSGVPFPVLDGFLNQRSFRRLKLAIRVLPLLLLPTGVAAETFQVKYEPITRQCDLFISHKYTAHFDLLPQDEGCMFVLPSQVSGCTLLQRRNAKRSEIGMNTIILEYDHRNKVAFNTYRCRY